MSKVCSKCKIKKNDGDFNKTNFSNKWGQCKACCKIARAKHYRDNKDKYAAYVRYYYKSNKDKIDDRNKTYYKQHKQEVNEYQKEWRQQNKEYKANYDKEYSKKRCKIDPEYKLRKRISNSVFTAIQRNGARKRGSILKFLQYSIGVLKEHLEKQFEPWMTWNNYGIYRVDIWDDNDPTTWTWQLDHIIPHSTFNYTSMEDQAFKDCWALSNLRPYSAKQNILDNARSL